MREFKFVPSICLPGEDGGPAEYEGHLVLTIPDLEQRMGYLEEMGFEVDDRGELKAASSNMGVVRKMLGLAKAHIKSVSIKNLTNNETISETEDLFYDPDMQGTLVEVGTKILHGVKVPKNSKP